jgi:hypothetical protein
VRDSFVEVYSRESLYAAIERAFSMPERVFLNADDEDCHVQQMKRVDPPLTGVPAQTSLCSI